MEKILQKADPERALELLKNLPEGSFKDTMTVHLTAKELAERPARWEALVPATTNPLLLSDIAKEAALQAAARNPSAATTFLRKISSDLTRKTVAYDAAWALANAKGINGIRAWVDNIDDPVVLSAIRDVCEHRKLPLPDALKPKK